MFKIISEAAARGICTANKLDVAGKLVKLRPFSSSSSSSSGNNHGAGGRNGGGLTDFSSKKECQQKACADRSTAMPPHPPVKELVPSCDKAASPKMWRACPEPPKPKEFSCDDTLQQKVPRRKKRTVEQRTACSKPAPTVEAPSCVKVKKELCPRTSVPGCGKAKFPPKCTPKKTVRDCIKLKPPVPSFSECYPNPFPPQPRSECNCLTTPKVC